MKLWGVVGSANSGKSEVMGRLVTEFTRRGLTVSTLKQADHRFDVDREGKDSHRHRIAGATEVLLASRNRWALMHELKDEDEPGLSDLLPRLASADLVLVEGFERDGHPKIEAHRQETGSPFLAPNDPTIRAIASDGGARAEGRPTFDLNDTAAIADFIAGELNL